MKTKQDFITNSSSTNFIISVPKGTKDINVSVQLNINLKDFIYKKLNSKQDIINQYDEEYLETDQGKEIMEELESGREVLLLSCSNENDDSTEEYLCEHGLHNIEIPEGLFLKIIEGDGGY